MPSQNVRLVPRYPKAVDAGVPDQDAKHDPTLATSQRAAEILQQMKKALPESSEKELLETIDEL